MEQDDAASLRLDVDAQPGKRSGAACRDIAEVTDDGGQPLATTSHTALPTLGGGVVGIEVGAVLLALIVVHHLKRLGVVAWQAHDLRELIGQFSQGRGGVVSHPGRPVGATRNRNSAAFSAYNGAFERLGGVQDQLLTLCLGEHVVEHDNQGIFVEAFAGGPRGVEHVVLRSAWGGLVRYPKPCKPYREPGGDVLTVDEALKRVLATVPRLPSESVPLAEAHGRILALDVVSERDVPPWDCSAMDGYAVRAADVGDDGARLEVIDTVAAGTVGQIPLKPGTATVIATGAPMPPGADAIVLVENSDAARSGIVTLTGPAPAGKWVRRRGSDIEQGQVVLEAGSRLSPARVGMAASLGFAHVSVTRRPRVAILATGNEVIRPGTPLKPGQIYSSNTYSLAGMVAEAGGQPIDMGGAPDTLEGLVSRLEACMTADVVLTTGGVSVGPFDFVKEAYEAIGVDIDFWKVKMKPGKPITFGHASRDGRRVAFFGLPGNPVSCLVGFLQFVRPWLKTALGEPRVFLPVVQAVADSDFRSRAGRARFERVALQQRDGRWHCASTGGQSSHLLTSMGAAGGLLVVPAGDQGPVVGETVRVQLLDSAELAGDSPDFGW